jgi:hypothetical protein
LDAGKPTVPETKFVPLRDGKVLSFDQITSSTARLVYAQRGRSQSAVVVENGIISLAMLSEILDHLAFCGGSIL